LFFMQTYMLMVEVEHVVNYLNFSKYNSYGGRINFVVFIRYTCNDQNAVLVLKMADLILAKESIRYVCL
jgi:hypothetical protein